MGAGAGALAAGMFFAPPARSQFALTSPGFFGRMFPDLPPFARRRPALGAALRDIGKPGGILDAKDDLLGRARSQLIVDPALSVNNPNNPTHTAGTTFMGQFMDHDMTFDLTSRLGVPTEPSRLAERAHAGLRPRLGLRRRAGRGSRAVRAARRPASSSGSRAAGCSRTCRATPTARRSSPIPATTRT